MGIIVIAAYRPKAGLESRLNELLSQHLITLREEDLVTEREPIVMSAADGTILEVFEWKSKAAIEAAHQSPKVATMWDDFEVACDYVTMGDLPESGQMFAEFSPVN